LDEEVDFMSSDMRGVRLFAMVLSPLREGPLHLRRVSRVVRLLKNEDLQMRLLEAEDEMQMQSLLVNPEGWMIAA
ncbi:MAG: PTS sugar transporter subunit IIA, partial [Micavibrio sp.]|nr:PTS sugar transporter subunit IIA [Micavibrio sp.]